VQEAACSIALAFLAMVAFATNILITRYAVARLSVEAGFLVVLATSIASAALIAAVEFALRAAPLVWNWRGVAWFVASGVVGTFLAQRLLFDTVRLLGPARASIFHSATPVFSLLAAWLLVSERLGAYEFLLMGVVWAGLALTHERPGTGAGTAPDQLHKGAVIGLLTIAGFGFSNAIRGVAAREWSEVALGTAISSVAAALLQLAVTRDRARIGEQFRRGKPGGVALYVGCGVATTFGTIFVTMAMERVEIALAALVVHTTPLVIFPFSVFVLKNREGLKRRTALGALIVLAGIALLALR
jgi:drug/metabolite transporter (DMT)-like permease